MSREYLPVTYRGTLTQVENGPIQGRYIYCIDRVVYSITGTRGQSGTGTYRCTSEFTQLTQPFADMNSLLIGLDSERRNR